MTTDPTVDKSQARAHGLPEGQGRLVSRRYRLLSPVGRGGMGMVWHAHDEVLDRAVAVKELLLHIGLDESGMAVANRRMIREARSAARLSHPSIVTVHDVVEEDGRPWIVMELLRARSLEQVVRQDGPLTVAQTASIGVQVLDALRHAHAAGILHRDVKPGNVLLTGERVVLTDFGIAAIEGDVTLTQTGLLMGSPAYIPPERLQGHSITPAADLWSFGATLYTAVEGRPPYEGADPVVVLGRVLTQEPLPPERAGALEPVLAGLLRKNPAERMSPAQLADALEQVLHTETGSTTPPVGRLPADFIDTPSGPVRVPQGPLEIPSGPIDVPSGPHRMFPESISVPADLSSDPLTSTSGQHRRLGPLDMPAPPVDLPIVDPLTSTSGGHRLPAPPDPMPPPPPSPPAPPPAPPTSPFETRTVPQRQPGGQSDRQPGGRRRRPARAKPRHAAWLRDGRPTARTIIVTTGTLGVVLSAWLVFSGSRPDPVAPAVDAPASAESNPQSPSSDGTPVTLKAYKEPRGVYSVSVPSDWTQSDPEEGVVFFTGPVEAGFRRIEIHTLEPSQGGSLAYMKQTEATDSPALETYQQVRLAPVSLGAWKAADWEYTNTHLDQVRLHSIRRHVTVGQRAYLFVFTVPDAEWAASSRVLSSLFETFQPAG